MANGNGAPPARPGGKPPMKKSTRNWILLGGVGAAGLIIWYVMRSKSAANQQAAATASTDPSIDPSTGLPWAAEMGGGVGGYGGGTPSLYGYYDPSTGQYITGTGAGGIVTQPTTNASWAQQAEQYLMTLGYDPVHTAAALGKYLTGQPLTPDQMSIVQAALAFFGQPPQGAPAPKPIPSPNPHPKPKPKPKPGPGGPPGPFGYKTLKVTKNETLAQFAKEHNWSARTLKLVEELNSLRGTSRLRKGQTIVRPEWNAPVNPGGPMQH